MLSPLCMRVGELSTDSVNYHAQVFGLVSEYYTSVSGMGLSVQKYIYWVRLEKTSCVWVGERGGGWPDKFLKKIYVCVPLVSESQMNYQTE